MLQPLQLQHNLKNATSMARCLIAIFCITIAPCLSASVGTTVKCLNLQINQQLQKLHSDCVHYENATAPQSVATDTQKPLLCILYLSSYQKACDKNVRIPKGELPAYNISVVCSYRDVLTDGVAEIAKLMEDRVACTGVCLDLDKGATVMPECNAAWYLNNLTRSLLRADVKPEEKQHEAQNVVSVTDKKQQAAVPETPQEKPVAAPEQVNTKEFDNQGLAQEETPQSDQKQQVEAAAEPVEQDARAKHPVETQDGEPKGREGKTVVTEAAAVAVPPAPKSPDVVVSNQAANFKEKIEEQKPNQPLKEETDKKPEPDVNNNVAVAAPNPVSDQQDPPKSQDMDHIDPPSPINEDANNAVLKPDDINFNDLDSDDDDALDEQGEVKYNKPDNSEKAQESVPQKPDKTYSSAANTQTTVDGDSYFFSYFMMLCIIIVLFYVGYHNKQKIRAIVLEGPRGRRQYRNRRPNSANYHKLDSNLEEAITSSTANKGSSHVIY